MSGSALWSGGQVGRGAGWPVDPGSEVDAGGEGEQALRDSGVEVPQSPRAGSESHTVTEVKLHPSRER